MKYLIPFILTGIFILPGCGNLSPRGELDNRIENSEGEIGSLQQELKELQNSINAEIGNIRTNAENIQNMQTGILNLNRENSGIQILQGDGPLVVVFALGAIFLLLAFYYREKSKKSEKVADILAEEVVRENNVNLEDEVFRAAIHGGVEKEVLKIIVGKQRKYGITK